MNYKQLVQSFLPNWTGRLAAHYVCYNGNGQVHRDIPYALSTSPANLAGSEVIIQQQLALMQAAGFDIAILTWQGLYANAQNSCAETIAKLCGQVGMEVALLLDPWCAKLGPQGVNSNYTANVISSLSNTPITGLPNYIPERYILDFNTGADLVALAKTFPSLTFLAQGKGFSWISIPALSDSVARNAAAVANLKAQNSNSGNSGNSGMRVPAICFSFDDSGQPQPVGVSSQTAFDQAGGVRNWANSVWGGPARVLESFAGAFVQQQLGVTPSTAPIIAVTTWNDYDERSSGPLERVMAEQNGTRWPS